MTATITPADAEHSIKVVVLGAGQDVGRSCILVSFCGRRVLFDCGMHLGYSDERRFPDFRYISKTDRFNEAIDCVIVSHFHLDHCGALPHLTEICGYTGPVFMTHPTRAITPILLHDYRKIMVERKGVTDFYSAKDIDSCMEKVVPINVLETVQVDEQLTITAYYAGHVLGAAMFSVAVGDVRVFYTGDFNMTADRHLGSARVPVGLQPQLVISESTYGTTLRDSKSSRERQFLELVHATVRRGGRVLIPVFAIGRAQELMILIEAYWERMGVQVPIYFSAGMVQRASLYYELFARWGSEHMRTTLIGEDQRPARGEGESASASASTDGSADGSSSEEGEENEELGSAGAGQSARDGRGGAALSELGTTARKRGARRWMHGCAPEIGSAAAHTNPFAFRRVEPFDRSSAATVGPCVLFATPGMLDSGASLDAFKAWAGDARNLVVLPSYCVPGTVGHKLLSSSASARTLPLDGGKSVLEVRCAVSLASFSAHADAKGIFTLLRQLQPRHVLFVHGDKGTVQELRSRVSHELQLPCYCPQNGCEVTIALPPHGLDVDVDAALLPPALPPALPPNAEHALATAHAGDGGAAERPFSAAAAPGHAAGRRKRAPVELRGTLVASRKRAADGSALGASLRMLAPAVAAAELGLAQHRVAFSATIRLPATQDGAGGLLRSAADLGGLHAHLERVLPRAGLRLHGGAICARSLRIARGPDALALSWALDDDGLAESVIASCDDWAELQSIGCT